MIKRISFLILLACCITTASFAQKSYDELTYPEINEFEKPDVVKFTTDNGIQFFLIEDHELPIIDVNVRIRTGGIQVPDSLTGLSAITGMVMRSGGTESIGSDSLNVLLENNAAQLHTGVGFTSGSAGLNVLKEDFDTLLPVFVDVLGNPAFPTEKIELAKKQAKSAISRRNDDVNSIAGREFNKLIYGENSKYGRVRQYATINNINRNEIINFHKDNFVGNNMMVGVVGDFNAGSMKKKLTKAFSEIPAGTENSLQFPDVNYDYKSTINFVNKPEVTQATVYMGHLGGTRPNPDYGK
ncbi:MAG TPA: insulinase family protein, partial [Balneolaceae bacterium]|nr:insulinase family protein [Balneolaceae bacterium]